MPLMIGIVEVDIVALFFRVISVVCAGPTVKHKRKNTRHFLINIEVFNAILFKFCRDR